MKFKGILLFLFSVLFLTSCDYKELIPVMGLGADGKPVQVFVPQSEYKNRLFALSKSVQKAAIPVLSRRKAQEGWMLRTMVFGLGVNAMIGIGPYHVGAFPQMRLVFSNIKDSFVP